MLAARNHVNRMCLAADVPLVESGTAGYLGQATVIKKVLIVQMTLSLDFSFSSLNGNCHENVILILLFMRGVHVEW